ncbi:MAG: hypothetical protein SFU56_00175 [Capsulimonadales bacterium]|nr:hypothetical protein [Capsulimonadales bacterium]
MSAQLLSVFARFLLVAWSGWWTFFVLASALNDPGSTAPLWQGLSAAALGTLLFAGSGFFAWRWPRPGAYLMIVEGAALTFLHVAFFHNPLPTRIFLIATMALPPLIVGLLFLFLQERSRKRPC